MGYLDRLETYRDDMLKTLGDSISRASVNADPIRSDEYGLLPYGKEVHEALLHMLEEGTSMGFEVCNVDNYAGYIEFPASEDPESAEVCGIVGHLDVMPEGTGWTGDPFVMREENGFVYGRGTSDDKGPVVASLYAMKALKEEGIRTKKNIRLVLGLNEETGDSSIAYYIDRFGHPDLGFTPDGEFPVVNGEMGILVFDLARKFSRSASKDVPRLTRFESGTAHNAVPADARAVIAGDGRFIKAATDLAEQYASETGHSLKARKQGASLVIEAKGIAAHGAHPDLGLNAASIMMEFLGRISFANEELNDFIAFYNDHIGFNLHGEKIGCDFKDNPSGPLIFNVGVVNINEELASVTINIRYPVTFTDRDVLEGMEGCLSDTSIGIVTRMAQGPIFMETDVPMVAKMIDSYREETGDMETAPIVQAGGTYAKMVNNILCFGGQFPGEEDTMHQANEKLSIDSLMKMARIYARAIFSLCCE